MSNDPELIGRMCKKISQLTRVIYLLNTRNDESDSLIKSILKSYDSELENFRKEANEVIKIKLKIEKSKETSLYDNKIKDIKKIWWFIYYINSADKLKKEVNKKKTKYKEMIKKIESNFNKKLNEKEKEIKNLKTQLENLKKGYEGQIKE